MKTGVYSPLGDNWESELGLQPSASRYSTGSRSCSDCLRGGTNDKWERDTSSAGGTFSVGLNFLSLSCARKGLGGDDEDEGDDDDGDEDNGIYISWKNLTVLIYEYHLE